MGRQPSGVVDAACGDDEAHGNTLASSDKWHRGRGNGQELDVGVERQRGHVENGGGDVAGVECRLSANRAVGLRRSLADRPGEFGGGVAYVDLAAGDAVLSAI